MNTKHDAVLTYHTNILTCGIARFNKALSTAANVDFVQMFDADAGKYNNPILSIKVSEFTPEDSKKLLNFCKKFKNKFSLFLHGYDGNEVEKKIIDYAKKIFVGNVVIRKEIQSSTNHVIDLWCPNSNEKKIKFQKTDLTFFSFGMAHKVKVKYYENLKKILDNTEKSYSIYLSTALHENTSFEESFFDAFKELKIIFNKNIYFLGFLSDSAVYNYLNEADYFLAFFEKGIRANNTSAYSAFETKTPLITNLDADSPPEFMHEKTLIDINMIEKLDYKDDDLLKIANRAFNMYETKFSWQELVKKIEF